jgi:transposase
MNGQDLRLIAVGMSQAGLSIRVIADRLRVPKSSVGRWISRYRELGHVNRKKGSGRPMKLSSRDVRRILRDVSKKPFSSCNEVIANNGIQASRLTVWRA